MSTKSSIVYIENEGDHKLNLHAYREMHQADDTIVFDIHCSTCSCAYRFLMDSHLGMELAEIIKRGKT